MLSSRERSLDNTKSYANHNYANHVSQGVCLKLFFYCNICHGNITELKQFNSYLAFFQFIRLICLIPKSVFYTSPRIRPSSMFYTKLKSLFYINWLYQRYNDISRKKIGYSQQLVTIKCNKDFSIFYSLRFATFLCKMMVIMS